MMGKNGFTNLQSLALALICLGCGNVTFPLKVQKTTVTTLRSGTSHNLYSVFFVNENAGFVVGDGGTILRTTNGGTTWANVSFATNLTLTGVYFLNTDTGFVCGHKVLLRTTNSGNSWTKVDSTFDYENILFSDYENGIYSGISQSNNSYVPAVGISTNSGASWQSIGPNLEKKILCLGISSSFLNSSSMFLGLAVPAYGYASVYRTTNGGSSWDSVYSNTRGIFGIQCVSSTVVYMCSDSGLIVKSTDFGSSWQSQPSGSTAWLNSIYFVSPSVGYIIGFNGTILSTVNGGTTWSSISSGTTQDLYKVYFPDASVGFVVGLGGTILKLTENS
ncbi:MAG: YCF48-related protein [Bacteroidota bacterium]|nr:YCF48-related protein [Bacteroidota bacterium]MDP4228957.1 YCF48-related protein [Bacteroidota bacterium]